MWSNVILEKQSNRFILKIKHLYAFPDFSLELSRGD